MRLRISRLLSLLGIGTALLLGLRLHSMSGSTAEPVRVPAALLDRAIRSPAFVVETDRWLDFDLPDGAERLRLLTNANLAPSARQLTDEQLRQTEWTYRVNYELLGVRGVVLDSGTYSFRTKLDRFIDPVTREPFSIRFYDDRPNCLAVTQELNVSCRTSSQRARRLRVCLEPLDQSGHATLTAPGSTEIVKVPVEITEIAARLFCLCDRPASHLTQSWRKLSEQQRERLTAGLIHPHERLEEQTRVNLLRTLWLPAAPSGQEGVTYEQRTLFTLHGVERFATRAPLIESAFRVAAGHRGMLPAPPEPGRLELEFQAIVPPDRFVLPDSVEVLWYGTKPHERASYHITLPKLVGDESDIAAAEQSDSNDSAAAMRTSVRAAKIAGGHTWRLELPSHGGLFEVISSAPMFVRATWQSSTQIVGDQSFEDNAAALEVTPEPTVLRPYRATPTEPVEFRLAHLSDQPAPIRITARAIDAGPAESSSDIGLEWRYLDQHGDIVQRGHLAGVTAWSEYDHYAIAPVVMTGIRNGPTGTAHTPTLLTPGMREASNGGAVAETGTEMASLIPPRVSEPLEFYFQIPAHVRRLQIVSAGQPLLIAAASRPTDIAKRTDIPEDYSAYHRRQSDNRSWFGLRATTHLNLIEQDRAPVIALQPRPPRDNQELATGRFTWRDFLPQGDWRARHLFTPRDPAQPTSADGATFVFHELTASHTETITFLVEPGQQSVTPTLVYRFENGTPKPIDIMLNGRRHHRLIPQAKTGELVLPSIVASADVAMELRIESAAPVKLWMDHLAPDQRHAWLRRLAIEATRREFTFLYRKDSNDEEHLSLRLFRPAGASDRATLHVRIDSPLLAAPREPTTTHTLTHRIFSLAPGDGPTTIVLPGAGTAPLDAGRVCLIPLGADLPPGDYSIHVTIETPDAVKNSIGDTATAATERQFVIVSRTAAGTDDRRDFSLETIRETESNAESDSAP